jgi:hypothetical protein
MLIYPVTCNMPKFLSVSMARTKLGLKRWWVLKAVTGYVRSELGKRIRLRRTPEVLFKEDRSFERGSQVLSLINQLSADRQRQEDSQVQSDDGLEAVEPLTQEDVSLPEE